MKCPIGLRVKKSDKVGERIFMEGNSAAALGAVYGGATVCAWYPITPSSSVAEAFTSHCKKLRHDPETGKAKYAIVQGEDGTLPLDELYFALRPGSVNLGEVDHRALLAGQPQTLARNPDGAYRLMRIGDAVASRNIHAAVFDGLRHAKDL